MIALVLDKYKRVKGTISNKGTYPFILKSHFENLDNSAISIEFEVPMDNYMSQHITDYGHVAFERNGILHIFKNLIVEENRARRTKNVMAVGVAVELSKKFVEPFSNEKRTAKQHAEFFLTNTPWQVGEFYYNGVKTMSSDKQISVLEAVQRIRTTFGVDILFRVEEKDGEITGYYMDILERRGVVYPKRFEVGKNIEGIRRKIDSSELVTALYGYGERDESENTDEPLTFADVEWRKSQGDPVDKPLGQTWVGDPGALSKYSDDGTHIFGVHESTVKGDPADLLKYTWQVLQNKNKPKITYEVDISLLGNIGVGDTLNIADFTNKDDVLLVEARVHEKDVIYLPNGEQRGKVTLKNFREIEYETPDYIETINKRLKLFATKIELEQSLQTLENNMNDTINTKIQGVNKTISDLNLYIDGAFSDGIIDISEAQAIEKYLNTLNAEKESVDNRYNQVYNDTLLKNDTKVNLNVKKTAFDTAHTDLINAINLAVADGKATVEEKTEVDSKFTVYKNALGMLSDAFEKAVNFIAQEKSNLAQNNATAYTDVVKTQINSDIADVSTSVSDLNTYVDGSFKDGIISNAEATAIEKYLNTVNAEKADIDGRYTEIYSNPNLKNETIKNNLTTRKYTYNNAHTDLINSINTAILDGQTTIEEKRDVDNKFAIYRNALNNLTVAFEQSLTSISQQQADNIQVGVRNLISSAKILNRNLTNFDKSKYTINGTVKGNVNALNDGFYFNGLEVKPNTYYVLSFNILKVSGTLTKIGGHTDATFATQVIIKIDGKEYTGTWSSGIAEDLLNDGNWHTVEYYFKTPTTIDSSHLLYVQPNRGLATAVGFQMTGVQLREGNKLTTWAPPPEDVERNANTYTDNKDATLRQNLNDGLVAVNGNSIVGQIEAGKLDLDLVIQGGNPPYVGEKGMLMGSYFCAFVPNTVIVADFLAFRHVKRYLTLELYGFWAYETSGTPPMQGYAEHLLSTTMDTSGKIPGTYGIFTVRGDVVNSGVGEQYREITIDLGTPTGQFKKFYLIITAIGNNQAFRSYTRMGMRFQHD